MIRIFPHLSETFISVGPLYTIEKKSSKAATSTHDDWPAGTRLKAPFRTDLSGAFFIAASPHSKNAVSPRSERLLLTEAQPSARRSQHMKQAMKRAASSDGHTHRTRPMANTLYTIDTGLGIAQTDNPEHAEILSKNGCTVTAVTATDEAIAP